MGPDRFDQAAPRRHPQRRAQTAGDLGKISPRGSANGDERRAEAQRPLDQARKRSPRDHILEQPSEWPPATVVRLDAGVLRERTFEHDASALAGKEMGDSAADVRAGAKDDGLEQRPAAQRSGDDRTCIRRACISPTRRSSAAY